MKHKQLLAQAHGVQ